MGHECVNELIVDRLLTILKVDHLDYELIHADIEVEGKTYETYLCASYDFCVRNGWEQSIKEMIVVDFLILNRDRHGANIEVLRNPGKHTLRIAPIFDHGLSLLYSCATEEAAKAFDILEDRACRNFIVPRYLKDWSKFCPRYGWIAYGT